MTLAARSCFLLLLLHGIAACGGVMTPQDDGTRGVDNDDAGTGGGNPGGTDAGAFDRNATCDEQSRAAARLVSQAVTDAEMDSLSCDTDADCLTERLGTDCWQGCNENVGREGAARIRAAEERANATVCRGFAEMGCKAFIPPCSPPAPWVCLQGACWGILH